jgi:RNA polymerase sigma-70 factor (ECF subfamily)
MISQFVSDCAIHGTRQRRRTTGAKRNSGDQDAFDAFVSQLIKLLPDLERRALVLSRGRVEADDLLQETCCRALASWSQLEPNSDLRAWLMRVLRNHHVDQLRRLWREQPWDDIEVPGDTPEVVPVWHNFDRDLVAHAVAQLPQDLAKPYRLRTDGLSYAEIARRTGVCQATVGTRIHRARLELRRLLGNKLA